MSKVDGGGAGTRIQRCSLCKNHGLDELKKQHKCKYEICNCDFCNLTRRCQRAMRHQQRLWRHQKNTLRQMYGSGEIKGQVCDKCRNHDSLVPKKDHNCPHTDCKCSPCKLNHVRKELMKHQQRVRRSNVTGPAEDTDCPPSEKDSDKKNQQKQDVIQRMPDEIPIHEKQVKIEANSPSSESGWKFQPSPQGMDQGSSSRSVSPPSESILYYDRDLQERSPTTVESKMPPVVSEIRSSNSPLPLHPPPPSSRVKFTPPYEGGFQHIYPDMTPSVMPAANVIDRRYLFHYYRHKNYSEIDSHIMNTPLPIPKDRYGDYQPLASLEDFSYHRRAPIPNFHRSPFGMCINNTKPVHRPIPLVLSSLSMMPNSMNTNFLK